MKTGQLSNIFKLPFSAISFGNSRGGKSHKMVSILLDPRYKIFDRIQAQNVYVISPTQQFDSTMTVLVDSLREKSVLVTDNNFITDIGLALTVVSNIIED